MMPTEQADQGDTRHKLAERLRSAWMQIQAGKRAVQEPDMQPIWDVINALPEVIHELDQMPEFEADGMAEKIEALTAERDGLQARVGELEALVNEQADALEEVGDGTCGIHCEAEGSYDHADLIAKARALLTPPAPHSDGER